MAVEARVPLYGMRDSPNAPLIDRADKARVCE